jgi:hypothetical protein
MMKTNKGGVFAPADTKLILRALEHYKRHLVSLEESERTTSAELNQLANLLHRISNRT